MLAEDYRAAAVFESYGIDFCCDGHRQLDVACQTAAIDKNELLNKLKKTKERCLQVTNDYHLWPADLLADYIEKKHHRYVEGKIPLIREYLTKISEVHGQNHPELLEIEKLFNASADELIAHMKKEEFILFPFVRKMMDPKSASNNSQAPHFGSVNNPIQAMMHEHDNEGERFRKISQLSNRYTPPSDACNTFKVAYSLLKEFEEDLHLHIHLENNILFPEALKLEKKVN